MNINGTITREEIDRIINGLKNTYKSMAVYSNLYQIFLILYSLAVLFVLSGGLSLKQELFIVVGAFCSTITFIWWKKHFKRRKERKELEYLAETDKALNTPQEYVFTADDEKIVVNDSLTVCLSDAKYALLINGYVVITAKDKTSVLIATDDEQQIWFYDYFMDNKTTVMLASVQKKTPFANKGLLKKFTKIRKNSVKKARKKELLQAGIVTLVVMGCMAVVGYMNSKSARDNRTYTYYGSYDSPLYQMAEDYEWSKSYKAMHDDYFDWMAKSRKTIVAIKEYSSGSTEIKIFYTDENNEHKYVLYQDSAEKQIRYMDSVVISDRKESVSALSDFETLIRKYPYVSYMLDFSSLDFIHVILKDKNPFTIDKDSIEITYSPFSYSCESENGDYRYTIYFSDRNVENPQRITQYLAQKTEECNSTPYNTVPFTARDILTEFNLIR